MASANADEENQNSISKKAMNNSAIDLDKSRLKLCIEILPEIEAIERMVIISICREQGMPLIQTIRLNELVPIPLPLAQIIQAYATSQLARQEPIATVEEERPESITITKRSLVTKVEQMALL
ncbi:MAG: hypothetical protein ACK6BN_17105 [Pseudanabaena sp.]